MPFDLTFCILYRIILLGFLSVRILHYSFIIFFKGLLSGMVLDPDKLSICRVGDSR